MNIGFDLPNIGLVGTAEGGAMAHQEQVVLTQSSHRQEPTAASVWYSLTGNPISDELLDWPADIFALTDIILGRSEVYRFVLSPPHGVDWPPSRIPGWSKAVEEAGRQWSLWVENREAAFPDLLAEEWLAFRERIGMSIEDLAAGHDWRMCEGLMTLHAIADEACAGLGATLDGTDRKGSIYRAHGRELLARTGSLARIHTRFLRVLPKLRTIWGLWRKRMSHVFQRFHRRARTHLVPHSQFAKQRFTFMSSSTCERSSRSLSPGSLSANSMCLPVSTQYPYYQGTATGSSALAGC